MPYTKHNILPMVAGESYKAVSLTMGEAGGEREDVCRTSLAFARTILSIIESNANKSDVM
jgi:hypothetical protein